MLNEFRSPQDIEAHRAQISIEVEVFFDGYWQGEMSEIKRNLILADWCNELEKWTMVSIKAALSWWRRHNPNKKPNPGHIVGKLDRVLSDRMSSEAKARARHQKPPALHKNPDRSVRLATVDELNAKYPGWIKRMPEVTA